MLAKNTPWGQVVELSFECAYSLWGIVLDQEIADVLTGSSNCFLFFGVRVFVLFPKFCRALNSDAFPRKNEMWLIIFDINGRDNYDRADIQKMSKNVLPMREVSVLVEWFSFSNQIKHE